jgi:hypothetical protein
VATRTQTTDDPPVSIPNIVGNLLDLPLLPHSPNPSATMFEPNDIDEWHAIGTTDIWMYYHPFDVRLETAYRRNYGLQAMALGFTGVTSYAYQAIFGESQWDDMDDPIWKDHMFTYPTIDGVIDTTYWESHREAYNDVRYAATLLSLGGTVPDITDRNLDEVREEMIDQILLLTS